MNRFIVYSATGEILRHGVSAASDIAKQASSDNEYVMEVAEEINDCLHYVVDGQIVDRPQMPINILCAEFQTNNGDVTLIEDIPTGTEVHIHLHMGSTEIVGTVDDGTLEFSSGQPGTYIVRLSCFPYITWTGEFNAN